MKYITERTEIAKFFREHKIIKINKVKDCNIMYYEACVFEDVE